VLQVVRNVNSTLRSCFPALILFLDLRVFKTKDNDFEISSILQSNLQAGGMICASDLLTAAAGNLGRMQYADGGGSNSEEIFEVYKM